METLVRMKGSSKTAPVHDVRWAGITFRDARPTFMAAHEATSGGDWAMHRGASVVLENAERVTMVGCTWDGVHGNGLIMSRYVRNCTVTASTFMNIGETAVRRTFFRVRVRPRYGERSLGLGLDRGMANVL